MARKEASGHLPHRARPHDHQQVAVAADDLELLHDRLEGVEVHGGDPAPAEPIDQVRGTDAMLLDLRVPHEVDVRHDDDVGGREALGELLEQETRAAVLVRLEYADQTSRVFGIAKGLERVLDLGGMMPVVVVHRDVAVTDCAGAEALETPIESRERVQCRRDGGNDQPGNLDPHAGQFRLL